MSCHRKAHQQKTSFPGSSCDPKYRGQKHAKIIRVAFVFWSLSLGLWGQSLRNQSMDLRGRLLILEAPYAAEIRIQVSTAEQLELTYQAEGEYQNETSIAVQSEPTTLQLSEIRLPTYYNPQDKLSAHKYIASQIDLTLPLNTPVEIRAQEATLEITGPLASTRIALDSGRCALFHWASDADIQTREASVYISGRDLQVDAQSREGVVEVFPESDPKARVQVKSRSGNIRYQREQ